MKRLTDGDIAEILGTAGADCGCDLCRLSREVKERRAADLSEQDVEALRWLRHDTDTMANLCSLPDCNSCNRHRRAVAAVDRLLKGSGK